MKRRIVLLGVGAVTAAAVVAIQPLTQLQERQRPAPVQYDLQAETQIKEGIRPFAETLYKFQMLRAGEPQGLWTLKLMEKYGRHWISPSGYVWVLTENMPGPGGGSRIWVRDTVANTVGEWATGFLPPTSQQSSDRSVRPLGPPRIEDIFAPGGTALELSTGYPQLRLPLQEGGELRLTAAHPEGRRISLHRHLRPGARDLFTEMVSEPGVRFELHRPDDHRARIMVWTREGGQGNALLQVVSFLSGGPIPSVSVEREEELRRPPTHIEVTPGGRILLFDIGREWEPNHAKLRVLSPEGNTVNEFDLLAEGRYASAAEVRRSLRYRDARVATSAGVRPLRDAERQGAGEHEIVEFLDDEGQRFTLILKGRGGGAEAALDVQRGLGARRPKEPVLPGARAETERFVKSESGRFKVRIRRWSAPVPQYTTTLLTSLNGEPREVEMWSRRTSMEPIDAFVSNSGRVFLLEASQVQNEQGQKVDHAVLTIWEPDQKQLAGFTLIDKDWYSSIEHVRRRLDLSKIEIGYEGVAAEVDVEGVSVPQWERENLVIPLGDGRTRQWWIGFIPHMGRAGLYRVGPPR
jgi:hypothetical protein